jgi:hypothetical protein
VIVTRWNILAGLSVSLGLFVVLNYAEFRKPAMCDDCFFPRGLPFTFFQAGGFLHDYGFVWRGAAADLLVVLVIAAATAYMVSWVIRKLSP